MTSRSADPQRITRITRKLEIVWLHVPHMPLMRLLRDLAGDQQGNTTPDAMLERRLNEIIATTERGDNGGGA